MLMPRLGWNSVTLRARGDAPAATAWERYAVPALWPTWSPQIRSVSASADRIAPGVTGTVRSVGPVAVRFRVEEVDELARRWSWSVGLGRLRVRLTHEVRAAPGGSRTLLRLHAPALVVAPYLPIAQVALNRLVRL